MEYISLFFWYCLSILAGVLKCLTLKLQIALTFKLIYVKKYYFVYYV